MLTHCDLNHNSASIEPHEGLTNGETFTIYTSTMRIIICIFFIKYACNYADKQRRKTRVASKGYMLLEFLAVNWPRKYV